MDVQRHAVAKQGRHHRNFLRGQFTGKRVFLANRGIGPAARPIEFGDHRRAILDADLIHPILVAVERQHPAVATMARPPRSHPARSREKARNKVRRCSCDEFYRYHASTPLGECTLLECQPCDFPDLSH